MNSIKDLIKNSTSTQTFSRVLRAARKLRGLTQKDMIGLIEEYCDLHDIPEGKITQGQLSKYENQIFVPSVVEWQIFCVTLNVPFSCGHRGQIDHETSLTDGFFRKNTSAKGFKMAWNKDVCFGSSVRSTLPLISYSEKALGKKFVNDYLANEKIDPDYFVVLDQPIPAHFSLGLLDTLYKKGHFTGRNKKKGEQSICRTENHGLLGIDYKKKSLHRDRLIGHIDNLKKYEINCDYKYLAKNKKTVEFELRPREHFQKTLATHKFESLDKGLCDYRKIHIENPGGVLMDQHQAQVKELECFHKGEDRCIFQVQYPS